MILSRQAAASVAKSDIFISVAIKGNESYIFIYDGPGIRPLMKILFQFATDDNLSFTWTDAALLRDRLQKRLEEIQDNPHDAR